MLKPIIIVALAHSYALFAQPYILLENPSFEGEPTPGRPPVGWYFCGEPGESPPDIHPGGFFNVEKAPQDGRSYLGMVVRDNGTNEGVGQALVSPLQAGSCYSLSLYAARSMAYQSYSRRTGAPAAFTEPASILIWGGHHNCHREQLLANSPPIENEHWQQYDFLLDPEASFTHLFIEAFYVKAGEPYNGNVLVDHLGPALPVNCTPPHDILQPLEQLAAPPLSGTEPLRTFLIEQARHLKFLPDTEKLEQHVFTDSTGRVYQANKYLWLIGRALKQFPGQHLLLATDGPTDFLASIRLQQAYYSLIQAGLLPEQLTLRRRKRSDQRREWLLPPAQEGILLRLF